MDVADLESFKTQINIFKKLSDVKNVAKNIPAEDCHKFMVSVCLFVYATLQCDRCSCRFEVIILEPYY